jgi:hypothetical protein
MFMNNSDTSVVGRVVSLLLRGTMFTMTDRTPTLRDETGCDIVFGEDNVTEIPDGGNELIAGSLSGAPLLVVDTHHLVGLRSEKISSALSDFP